jgi:tryptophanyl-tRNA synthetase
MFTDPRRIRITDPGHPEECNVYTYYEIFAPQKRKDVYNWCTGAQKGCTDCKKILADSILEKLAPIREKRETFARNKNMIRDILDEGRKKAKVMAEKTIAEVKDIVFGKAL